MSLKVNKFEFNSRDHVRIIIRGRKVNLIDERTKQFSTLSKRAPFEIDPMNESHIKWIFKEFNRGYSKFKLKFVNSNNGNSSGSHDGYIDKNDGQFYPYNFTIPFNNKDAYIRWINNERNSNFTYLVYQLEK